MKMRCLKIITVFNLIAITSSFAQFSLPGDKVITLIREKHGSECLKSFVSEMMDSVEKYPNYITHGLFEGYPYKGEAFLKDDFTFDGLEDELSHNIALLYDALEFLHVVDFNLINETFGIYEKYYSEYKGSSKLQGLIDATVGAHKDNLRTIIAVYFDKNLINVKTTQKYFNSDFSVERLYELISKLSQELEKRSLNHENIIEIKELFEEFEKIHLEFISELQNLVNENKNDLKKWYEKVKKNFLNLNKYSERMIYAELLRNETFFHAIKSTLDRLINENSKFNLMISFGIKHLPDFDRRIKKTYRKHKVKVIEKQCIDGHITNVAK